MGRGWLALGLRRRHQNHVLRQQWPGLVSPPGERYQDGLNLKFGGPMMHPVMLLLGNGVSRMQSLHEFNVFTNHLGCLQLCMA